MLDATLNLDGIACYRAIYVGMHSFISLNTCLFIQQIFTEPLLRSKHSPRHQKHSGNVKRHSPLYCRGEKERIHNYVTDQVSVRAMKETKVGQGPQPCVKGGQERCLRRSAM